MELIVDSDIGTIEWMTCAEVLKNYEFEKVIPISVYKKERCAYTGQEAR